MKPNHLGKLFWRCHIISLKRLCEPWGVSSNMKEQPSPCQAFYTASSATTQINRSYQSGTFGSHWGRCSVLPDMNWSELSGAARLEPFQRSAGPTAAKETLYNAKQLCQHASRTIVNKYNKYLTLLHVCPALVVVLWCTHLLPTMQIWCAYPYAMRTCIVYCIYACVVLNDVKCRPLAFNWARRASSTYISIINV